MKRTRTGKYNAQRTTVDGHTFDSKREATRYQILRLLEKAGQIHHLKLQVPFILQVGDVTLGKYLADFVYWDEGGKVVEDCKGFRTPLYKWKKRHVEAQYGLEIKET